MCMWKTLTKMTEDVLKMRRSIAIITQGCHSLRRKNRNNNKYLDGKDALLIDRLISQQELLITLY